jgi:hypothetical protein
MAGAPEDGEIRGAERTLFHPGHRGRASNASGTITINTMNTNED